MSQRARSLAWALVLLLAAGAASAAQAAPTEWWVIAARFDSGESLVFELTLTDQGPGERNAAAVGHWVAADGKLTPFRRAMRGGSWKNGANGRRIDLEKLIFDRSGERAQLRVEKKSLRIALDFPLAAQPLARRDLSGGAWTQELWTSGAPAEVSFWQRGLAEPLRARGLVAVSHRSVRGGESKLAARRLEAFSLANETRLYVVELASAKRSERWVVVDQGGQLLADAIEVAPPLPALASVPERIELPGAGPVRGELRAGREIVAYDPLAELPGPVRWVVSLAIRLRSAWMASPYDVTLSGAPKALRLRGTAIASYTFYATGSGKGK